MFLKNIILRTEHFKLKKNGRSSP